MDAEKDRDGERMTAADSLAVIDGEGRRVGQRITFNPAWINALWAAAWFFGFGAAYLAYGPDRVIPACLGPTVPAVLIIGSVAASIVYGARVGAGISGPSRVAGAMYGWCWTLGFGCLSAVNITLEHRGLSEPTSILLWSASSLLLVGVLQMTGGALWRDPVLYATGIWTMLCGAGAVLAGVPANFLVLALAGGGGFAVIAVYMARRHRR